MKWKISLKHAAVTWLRSSVLTAHPVIPSPMVRSIGRRPIRARARYQPHDQACGQQGPNQHVKGPVSLHREDVHIYVDKESGETIVCGMGELHLEVYIERMKREYGAEVETGAPQVAYRETIGRAVEYDYTHKKQTGGSGQSRPRHDRAERGIGLRVRIQDCGWCDRQGIYSIGREGFRSQMAKGIISHSRKYRVHAHRR